MIKKKKCVSWLIVMMLLSCPLLISAGKTEWLILQTRFVITGNHAGNYSANHYAQCLCDYCGSIVTKPCEDNTGTHTFCEMCGVTMSRFIKKHGCSRSLVEQESGSTYYQQMKKTFPCAESSGKSPISVMRELASSIFFETDCYGYTPVTKVDTFLADIVTFSAVCQDCNNTVEINRLLPHALQHLIVCNSCGQEADNGSFENRKKWLSDHEQKTHFHTCSHCHMAYHDDLFQHHVSGCIKQTVCCRICDQEMALDEHFSHALQHWDQKNHDRHTVVCVVCQRAVFLPDYKMHYEDIHELQPLQNCTENGCSARLCTGEIMLEHFIRDHSEKIYKAIAEPKCEQTQGIPASGEDSSDENARKLRRIIDLYRKCLHGTESSCEKVDRLCKQIETLQLENRQLQQEKNRFQQELQRINELGATLYQTQGIPRNGTCLWVINDVARLFKDSDDTPLQSPPFYSGVHGYKLCGYLYLRGMDEYKNTNVSVMLSVMPGEYDLLLPWPYEGDCSVKLVSRTAKSKMCRSHSMHNAKKPSSKKEITPICTFKRFCDIGIMHDGAYVKDDTMHILFSITPYTLQLQ